eukprot:scaffold3340_cov63-Phaeocystis_antarctica.AAC.9
MVSISVLASPRGPGRGTLRFAVCTLARSSDRSFCFPAPPRRPLSFPGSVYGDHSCGERPGHSIRLPPPRSPLRAAAAWHSGRDCSSRCSQAAVRWMRPSSAAVCSTSPSIAWSAAWCVAWCIV